MDDVLAPAGGNPRATGPHFTVARGAFKVGDILTPSPAPVSGATYYMVVVKDESHGGGHGIHMPSPSYFPVLAALALPILGYGVIFRQVVLDIDGALLLLAALFGWAIEPPAAEEAHA